MSLSLDDLLDQLADRGIDQTRPWSPPPGCGPFLDGAYALGMGGTPLEVCIVPASGRPKRDAVRDLWKTRQGRQASPLLLICPFSVNESDLAHTCGPGEQDMVVYEVDLDRAFGLAVAALKEPSGPAAVRYLREHAPSETQDFAGLRNMGMFAAHTLHTRVRDRPDWAEAAARGQALRDKEGRDLITALGFAIDADNSPVSVLRAPDDKARGVAVLLDRGEGYEASGGRFGESSALSLAFTRADRDNIPFVVLTRGSEIRLYAASGYQGVGRKGQAETYIQADLGLLASDETGFVPLIFSAQALAQHGSFGEILEWSKDFSAGLSVRLRQRVYDDVVPGLAVAIANQHAAQDHDAERDLESLYEETLVVLFRLLFLAYAEDRDLLPYRTNQLYQRNALKTIARELATFANDGKTWQGNTNVNLWTDVTQLFEAVDGGNDAWGVPLYNGGLFASDPDVSQIGAAIAAIKIPDEQFAAALTALLTEPGPGGVIGPVDFRSLSVRDFGTIYEGLLESSLSVATTDLVVDARGNYIPARTGQEPEAEAGSIYHHNRSGARKATGSYFTKDFAVEHLLVHAIEPALTEHLARIEAHLVSGNDDLAAQALFDFRCADLSMGSGHFLVAAVDHIERRIARFLDEHPLPSIDAELDRLRAAAIEQLGDSAAAYEIERRQLLRRQVARRCVYGVDRNDIAVELARLSLWIHTFVPGLPLSFLDHNLIQGDSLTGVGTVEEAGEYLTVQAAGRRAKHGQGSVFEGLIHGWLNEVQEPLIRLGRASDATKAELAVVRQAAAEAQRRAEPVRKLFDLICAMRLGEAEPFTMGITTELVDEHPGLPEAERAAQLLQSVHFPVAFPEVFLREPAGFDCLIGNPPWEKLQVEEHSFYALHYPGLRGLRQAEAQTALDRLREDRPDLAAQYEQETAVMQRTKAALAKGPYPGLTSGRPDLFKAFAWRFWRLLRRGGYMGLVLPRKSLEASGTATWRRELLETGVFVDVTMLVNRGGWVFDEVHQQYTIGLVTVRSGQDVASPDIQLRGPFSSLSQYEGAKHEPAQVLPAGDLLAWSDTATFPLVRDADAMRVFLTMRSHPRLDTPGDGWEPRGLRELNATDDKEHFVFDRAEAAWPVYKGESFDLWTPDTGTYYAWADAKVVVPVLQARRANQVRLKRSAFYNLPAAWAEDPETLPCYSPRIVWRDTARATDSRTVRCALVPPKTILVHQAYYLFWRAGGPREQAFALGVLSSIPFDWYARQLVESHVTVEFMRSAPIPRPSHDDSRRLRVIEIASRLAASDERFSDWAAEVGVSVGGAQGEEKQDLLSELDACVASLYSLTSADLSLIFRTFHVGWDFEPHLERVLDHLEALRES